MGIFFIVPLKVVKNNVIQWTSSFALYTLWMSRVWEKKEQNFFQAIPLKIFSDTSQWEKNIFNGSQVIKRFFFAVLAIVLLSLILFREFYTVLKWVIWWKNENKRKIKIDFFCSDFNDYFVIAYLRKTLLKKYKNHYTMHFKRKIIFLKNAFVKPKIN